ncbi:hypothetical protein [Poseidonibacter lekithochrous]|uniref:hypothetical protein n=1 Tax=Poseidonibacter lekithochrous TaxID=1904463 RepID=UPI000D35A356|nr:hypothetical protein [Poseidonibacter lekithochrous]
MNKLYLFIVLAVLVVAAIVYGAFSYKDTQHEKSESSYRNEINTLKEKSNKLEIDKKESKAKKDFVMKESKVVEKSIEEQEYTNQMLGDKDVKEFDDTF